MPKDQEIEARPSDRFQAWKRPARYQIRSK